MKTKIGIPRVTGNTPEVPELYVGKEFLRQQNNKQKTLKGSKRKQCGRHRRNLPGGK
ncbi:MAG TPA: hypothetical protein PKK65_03455 [bacterium]|jgi:hypothetical protein|nr:hypothetical protein [bacterium]HPV70860.1 hypothetical protein [Candidatus Magasanikbacteria bacterium]HPY99671.1 hypothetical protein [bacterium]HQB76444.1 hypothetical protein [bacterium]HQL34908.1 hypothetical protein [bacterium]